jgi:hypothetical protein
MRLFTSFLLVGSLLCLVAVQPSGSQFAEAAFSANTTQVTATQSINQGQQLGHRGSGRLELAAAFNASIA